MGNPTWGDGKRVGDEKWNDGNLFNGDGCSYQRWYCYSNCEANKNLRVPTLKRLLQI